MSAIGLLGCGAMGGEIASAVSAGEAGGATLVALFDQQPRLVSSLAESLGAPALHVDSFSGHGGGVRLPRRCARLRRACAVRGQRPAHDELRGPHGRGARRRPVRSRRTERLPPHRAVRGAWRHRRDPGGQGQAANGHADHHEAAGRADFHHVGRRASRSGSRGRSRGRRSCSRVRPWRRSISFPPT